MNPDEKLLIDYHKTRKFNELITSVNDYCQFLYEQNDEELWFIEWNKCAEDPDWFINHWLFIEDRDTRRTKRFEYNDIQKLYSKQKSKRDIIVKARKMGVSTKVCADFFADNCFKENTKSINVAHDYISSAEIFSTVRMFYDRLPEPLKPLERYNTKKELEFTRSPFGQILNTKYYVLTAGSKDIGRGIDADNLHLSEFASYKYVEELNTGLMQALTPSSNVVIESTAKGFNDFWAEFQRAKKGESNYKPHFYPWFIDSRYSLRSPAGLKLTDKEKKIKAAFNLSNNQMYWYQNKLKDPGMSVFMGQEYPATEEEAFLQSGYCVFDRQELIDRYNELEGFDPIHERLNGLFKIYVRPIKNHKYIVGVDTATGEGSEINDWSACVVYDRETGEIVAGLYGHIETNDFKKYVAKIGRMYNKARLVIENNSYGTEVVNYCRHDDHYPRLYKYKEVDRVKNRKATRYGFSTNTRTRPMLVLDFLEVIEEKTLIIYDRRLISEMLNFVKKDNGKIEHQEGCRDDYIFATMLVLFVNKRGLGKIGFAA